MRKIIAALAFLCLSAFSFGQTAVVTGHTITGQNTTSSSGISILFELIGDNGQQCKVAGTGLITPYSSTVTQAQLAAGISLIENSQITCGTTTGATRWRYTIKSGGTGTRQCVVNITAATNLDSTACLNATATPVTTTPTDSIYCRIDGSNCGFTGAVTMPSVGVSGNETVGGTLGVTGNQTNGGNVSVKGPNPWADVTQYGLVGDGTTDNVAAWGTMITSVCSAGSNVHSLYFPITSAGKYRFASKPAAISCEIIIQCGNIGAPVQWNPTSTDGAQLMADYTESTATNAFIDFTGSTSPGNSGIRGCQLWKGTGQTGGTAIKYEGASTTARAGAGPIEDTRISGDGTWNWGFRVDCTNITTAGSQGCRDIAIRNLDIFQTTTGAASVNNAVHLKWFGGGAFPTALISPNAHVDLTGITGAGGNSTNVELIGVEILDTLATDWVANMLCAGCYVNNLTATVNTTGSVFMGYSNTTPTINGQLAYYSFDLSSPAGYGTGLVNSIRATNFLCTGTAPSNVTTGDLCASSSTTGGNIKLGSDGQMIMRRNNGSGSGTNMAWTFDGFSTTPFQWDSVNGFTTTRKISSTLATGTAPFVIASTTNTPNLNASILTGSGTGATLTGTGACATITTQTGGAVAGRATCTGTTGASTLTITPGLTAPNGWVCQAYDQTTRANLLQQTSTLAASCTLTATSITQNDVFVFSAIAF